MQKIILELNKYNFYRPTLMLGKTLYIFQRFLTDINNSDIKFDIEWALDPAKTSLGCTNSTETNKTNNLITINSIFSDKPDHGPFFNITIPEFINALKKWEKVINLKPKKIVITEVNGIISIEAD